MSGRYRGAMHAAGGRTEREMNLVSYTAMVKAGLRGPQVEHLFTKQQLEDINDDVEKAYWAHVRNMLRTVPSVDKKLDVLGSALGKPPHEILDAIATAHFPELTNWINQKSFYSLRQVIDQMYKENVTELMLAVEEPQPVRRRRLDLRVPASHSDFAPEF